MKNERAEATSEELDAAEELIREACTRLQPNDFQFSVEARGTPWDIYKVIINDKAGLIAIRIHKGLEIGYCRTGLNHSTNEIIDALNSQDN